MYNKKSLMISDDNII